MTHAKIVWIEWVDSSTDVGWEEAGSSEEMLKSTITAGIFVKETIDAYVVANSYDPETDEFNGRISIPLLAIKKCRTLCQIQLPTTKK